MLDIKTLETWLWDAACSIRGAVDAPKFKDYILPLIFVKRISDRGQRIGPYTHDKVCFKGIMKKRTSTFVLPCKRKKAQAHYLAEG